MSHLFFFFFFLILLLLFSNSCSSLQIQNDTVLLTNFRVETDTHGELKSNWTGSNACEPGSPWTGVKCSIKTGRVVSLSLRSLSLRGNGLARLAGLDQLRFLDLSLNRLNQTLAPLTTFTNLKLVYLAGNDFSGEIPTEISALRRVLRLDLSDNNIGGDIPVEILSLRRVLTLRLQNNMITGKIPDFAGKLMSLKELNLTNNGLYGRVPISLVKRFGEESFVGNEGLCGGDDDNNNNLSLLPKCTLSGGAAGTENRTVPSNPTVEINGGGDGRSGSKGMSGGVIALVVVANCVALVIVASCLVARCCSRRRVGESESGESGKRRNSSDSNNKTKKVYDHANSGDSDGTTGTDRSKLVFFDRKKGFELEDLLRASAEMLGKGSLGTVYRAVLDDGCTVAVKRLKDANPCARREFEQYMDVIGKLRHPNVVRLRAYYYAKEEKLLVYDYLANGSLHQLLHGNRGPGRIPLDWTTRISLALGAARGLARIHEEYGTAKIPHGNVKSSNVLLDKNGVACVSDFGLSLLLNPVHAIARLGGYRAPEQAEVKRLSQKADVYSFGVLILEILTGRAPSQYPSPSQTKLGSGTEEDQSVLDIPAWVRSVVKEEWTGEVFDQELLRYKNIEEELVAMLHVGLACVVPQPEKRPTMVEVTKMIEDIRVEQSPLGEDYDESRNSLSPSLATTEDGLP